MLLTDILTRERIKIPLAATSREGVIEELVDLLAANGDLLDRDSVLEAVGQREKTRTTGIGSGLALPHGKCAGAGKLVMAIGKSDGGVNFQSIDGKPVTLIMLLASPMNQTGPHIQALARISRLMSIGSFRSRIDAASDAGELFEVISNQESQEQQEP